MHWARGLKIQQPRTEQIFSSHTKGRCWHCLSQGKYDGQIVTCQFIMYAQLMLMQPHTPAFATAPSFIKVILISCCLN